MEINKSVFVLWSSGLDSTFLILYLLNKGHRVEAGYCHIKNNAVKSEAELAAITKMVKQIKALFPKTFIYHGITFSAENNSNYRRGISYRQVPYFISALVLAPLTDYRAIAYVASDSSIKDLHRIRDTYNGYKNIHYGFFPELIFPTKNITKNQILEYMEKYYSDILDNVHFCEHPKGKRFEACGNCKPCSTFISVANKLPKKPKNDLWSKALSLLEI